MMCLYICHRLFVNLSAFVLVGSHLVLSNAKAESILGDFNRKGATVFFSAFTVLRLSFFSILFFDKPIAVNR